jgi:hypothetical protein
MDRIGGIKGEGRGGGRRGRLGIGGGGVPASRLTTHAYYTPNLTINRTSTGSNVSTSGSSGSSTELGTYTAADTARPLMTPEENGKIKANQNCKPVENKGEERRSGGTRGWRMNLWNPHRITGVQCL